MKTRHEIDESILLPKVKKVAAAAAVVAIVVVTSGVGSSAHAAPSTDRKMRHDAYVI